MFRYLRRRCKEAKWVAEKWHCLQCHFTSLFSVFHYLQCHGEHCLQCSSLDFGEFVTWRKKANTLWCRMKGTRPTGRHFYLKAKKKGSPLRILMEGGLCCNPPFAKRPTSCSAKPRRLYYNALIGSGRSCSYVTKARVLSTLPALVGLVLYLTAGEDQKRSLRVSLLCIPLSLSLYFTLRRTGVL